MRFEYFQLAYEFVLYIVVGISVGYILYQRYNNGVFVVVGFLLGVLLAFLSVFRLIRRKTHGQTHNILNYNKNKNNNKHKIRVKNP
ncbi:MAG TPA: AtpZ/AtpI family protein [Methanothermococcus okinawensis]|nr:AtpZ/AtpI family protein [Methanothermococcus okinawensis]